MFTIKNLCEVLGRRWFKSDKFEIALFGEEMTYPTIIDYKTNALYSKSRKPISQLLNIFDVAAIFQFEDALKLEYQIREVQAVANENSLLGKRQANKPDNYLELGPKLTPNGKKREPGNASFLNHSQHDDDYLSLFDNHENTNNLSLLLNPKNENSMLSNLANCYLNNFDQEESHFGRASNMDPQEKKSAKKNQRQSRGNSMFQLLDPKDANSKGELKTTFVFARKDETIKKAPLAFKQARVESLKLEATPSQSEGAGTPGKQSPNVKKDCKQKSTSEVSFEFQVQMLKEKIEKIDKEKLSYSNSGKDLK